MQLTHNGIISFRSFQPFRFGDEAKPHLYERMMLSPILPAYTHKCNSISQQSCKYSAGTLSLPQNSCIFCRSFLVRSDRSCCSNVRVTPAHKTDPFISSSRYRSQLLLLRCVHSKERDFAMWREEEMQAHSKEDRSRQALLSSVTLPSPFRQLREATRKPILLKFKISTHLNVFQR
jgi:hypothetical protein